MKRKCDDVTTIFNPTSFCFCNELWVRRSYNSIKIFQHPARQKIRHDKIPFEIPYGTGLEKRLQSVLESIYLLFNEGYSASNGRNLIRYQICEEAIRLTEIILNHPAIQNKPDVFALLAMMQLNASRFKARQDLESNILTLGQQQRSLWDYKLMEKGFVNLEKSTFHNQISIYHILAGISAYHCSAPDYNSTDWMSILSLYDNLMKIDNSPVILLNRAIALSKVNGAANAIAELEKISEVPSIKSYHLFYSTKAEFYIELSKFTQAIAFLQTAIDLAPLQSEKILLNKKLEYCCKKIS